MMASKISLSLTLVGTLLTAALGAGATYGATSAKVNEVVERVNVLERDHATVRERLGRMETALDYQNDALKRIEQRLGTKP